jgi:hypothetical protein
VPTNDTGRHSLRTPSSVSSVDRCIVFSRPGQSLQPIGYAFAADRRCAFISRVASHRRAAPKLINEENMRAIDA